MPFLVAEKHFRCYNPEMKNQDPAGLRVTNRRVVLAEEPNPILLELARQKGAPTGTLVTIDTLLPSLSDQQGYDTWSFGVATNCPLKHLTILLPVNLQAGVPFIREFLAALE